ncbi:unnamed protein product [Acanthoscelides obtectus]|uniref:Mitochondrial inner membrane protein Mpv17 n=1 Tax=Acanthoscelides obtectus TaxID=200917 RepID=A0A9P0JNT9_ACAOB|nr:unnamed protein product [Acanthoscelides obtectus]CAK1639642.1 Protein Mpv17 [Acanthoscelides obtectus]
MFSNFVKTSRLTVVQALQTGVLMGVGDAIAQTFVEKAPGKKYDPRRTGKFFLLGVGFVGPTLGTWYRVLASRFGDTGTFNVAVKKMALDQLVFAPSFLALFITTVSFTDGRNWRETKQQLIHKYPDIYLTNLTIWPAVQLVNFSFIPLRHQLLLVQSVAILWNCYLSWKTHKEIQ